MNYNNENQQSKGIPIIKLFVAPEIEKAVGQENQQKVFVKFLVRQIVIFVFIAVVFFSGAFFKIIDLVLSIFNNMHF